MFEISEYLKPEDYIEPVCPLCDINKQSRINIQRVVSKLDEHLNRNDCEGARRHLEYWLAEAQSFNDCRGEIAVRNELIGFYRKQSNKDKAFESIAAVLELLKEEKMEYTVTAGTVFLNCATAYKAFSEPENAIELYEKAFDIYTHNLEPTDERFGGLFNNFALALADMGRYEEANIYYNRALGIMQNIPGCESEQAITFLNMASCMESEKGLQQSETYIYECLSNAKNLLDSSNIIRDGSYAFVCEKCAGVFGYYGWFKYEKELRERAESAYEGH